MSERIGTRFPRRSGVLLHPTSLPGPDGCGDLGSAARHFVDWLADHKQTWWQVLPLGPTSYGDSPYQTLSAFAGNPLLISLTDLMDDGWLTEADLQDRPGFSAERVDFGAVIPWRLGRLERAWAVFLERADKLAWDDFRGWCDLQAHWLDDFALFMALKREHGGKPWYRWPRDLARRDPRALEVASAALVRQADFFRFCQWLFHRQWAVLRERARQRGVSLMGDMPIFVAHDSSDVWARQDLFQLDDRGRPRVVAGVPPDYFSKTGQLWGNPLYDWQAAADEDFAWWRARLKAVLQLVDVVRLDHFRGFEACWEVPAEAETAETGRWVQGPGADFFLSLQQDLGEDLPLVAEDLGVITPAVDELRRRFHLPGMRVLQFAWSGPDNLFLPHEYRRNTVVYTGTHDNDPVLGWWEHLTDKRTRELVAEYAGCAVDEPHWTLIRLGMMSVAETFIVPLQDVLGLGRQGRMNLPGSGHGNWSWRLGAADLEHPGAERLARMTWLYRRAPGQDSARRLDPAAGVTESSP